jgi:hypothetical protein
MAGDPLDLQMIERGLLAGMRPCGEKPNLPFVRGLEDHAQTHSRAPWSCSELQSPRTRF